MPNPVAWTRASRRRFHLARITHATFFQDEPALRCCGRARDAAEEIVDLHDAKVRQSNVKHGDDDERNSVPQPVRTSSITELRPKSSPAIMSRTRLGRRAVERFQPRLGRLPLTERDRLIRQYGAALLECRSTTDDQLLPDTRSTIRQKMSYVARLRWKKFLVCQGTTQYAVQQDDVDRMAPSEGW